MGTIAANAMTAITHETKQQTLTRKASVQETVTDTLLGETLKASVQETVTDTLQNAEVAAEEEAKRVTAAAEEEAKRVAAAAEADEEEDKVPEMLPAVHESKVLEEERAERNKKQSTIAANARAAIAGETWQQTLSRKASVQETVTKTLLGETIKWTFNVAPPGTNIQEIENTIVTQGGATGELVDACDGETGTISIYSHADQKFNTEQDLLIGTTTISAPQLSGVEFVMLANKIVFETNTIIVAKDSRHVCRRLANILNANPDIRIRVDGHVKMSKKARKNPEKMGQAERLSDLRAMSVRDKIAEYGVDADRLEYKGFGCSQPLPKGHDDKRVEIHVL